MNIFSKKYNIVWISAFKRETEKVKIERRLTKKGKSWEERTGKGYDTEVEMIKICYMEVGTYQNEAHYFA